jgi:hypothetical protein
VRGAVISIKGSINVEGEVNKDIISLFGNIHLTTGAVARGDILSINGQITIEDHASLYGDIFSAAEELDSKRFRFYREHEFDNGLMFRYNRVDGLLLGGTAGFVHSDSLFPSVDIGLGYAFESERLRYYLHAKQYLWKKTQCL